MCESVRLFAERAAASVPGFTVDRVRHVLGLAFAGQPYAGDFLLADVALDGAGRDDSSHVSFRPDGRGLACLPMARHRWRVVMANASVTPGHRPSRRSRKQVWQRAPWPITVSDPGWLACFRCQLRSTTAYRRGRVLLAGDEAHIHTPAGGPGMNTGMMDAANLAWKLALVAGGHAADSLLDTYETERLPAGVNTLGFTNKLFGWSTMRHPVQRAVDVVEAAPAHATVRPRAPRRHPRRSRAREGRSPGHDPATPALAEPPRSAWSAAHERRRRRDAQLMMFRPMSFGYCAGLPTDTTRLEGITAMAKVISTLFISADGVAEIDPEWHFPYFDDNMGRAVGEDYDIADVLLIGRETYDSFAGAWPGREAAGGDDAPFAKRLGDVRKVVVSRQRLEFSWRNSELIEGDLLDAVTSLKADAGIRGILIPGSISVVQQLLAAGLVDELRLLVHPVAARKGRRLFDDGDAPYHLKVTATEAFPTGVIRVIYSPGEIPAKVGYDEVKDQVPSRK